MNTDWFRDWLPRHLQRHDNAGLPDPEKKPLFYEAWRDEFAKLAVPYEVAEAASRLLITQKYVKHAHFAALLKVVKEAKYAGRAGDIDSIKAASANCPECGGEGYASVRDRGTKMNFAAYCICPYGSLRLRKAQREAKPNDVLIDLAKIRVGETFRVLIRGEVVTLDFTEEDDDGIDYTEFARQAIKKFRTTRQAKETSRWEISTTSRNPKSSV